MTPHDPSIMLKPLAAPVCSLGTNSVTAFIHMPLKPEIQKPNINTTGTNIQYDVPAGKEKRVNADNAEINAMIMSTITPFP